MIFLKMKIAGVATLRQEQEHTSPLSFLVIMCGRVAVWRLGSVWQTWYGQLGPEALNHVLGETKPRLGGLCVRVELELELEQEELRLWLRWPCRSTMQKGSASPN